APGDRCGSVNPTRSKTRQEVPEGCPPELPGRSLEACGNVGPRWMAATAPSGAGQNPAYRPAHPPIRSPGTQSGAQAEGAARAAAPTIPALLRSLAGTIGVFRSSSGRNFLWSLDTPPPTTN